MYNLMTEGLYVNQARATAVVLLGLVIGINGLSAPGRQAADPGKGGNMMNTEQTPNHRPIGRPSWRLRN